MTPEDVRQYFPFDIFRIVLSYIGVLPPVLSQEIQSQLCRHMKEKYCYRCGEYISCRQFISRPPVHLSCRQNTFIPDHQKTKYYHLRHVSLKQLWLCSDFSEYKCPVLFYSKQPKTFYYMRIDMETDEVFFEYVQNVDMTNVRINRRFCVLPELFKKSLICYPYNSAEIQEHTALETKVRFMREFKIHTYSRLFYWIYHINMARLSDLDHIHPSFFDFFFRYTKHNKELFLQISRQIRPYRIIMFHRGWARLWLTHEPFILERLSEKTIQKFFRENKKWFCRYVEENPLALKYITLVKNH